jgi:hypothetical protein
MEVARGIGKSARSGKRMKRASRGKEPPEFASDHPSDQHRIERIEKWLPEAERAYTPASQS